MIAIWWPRAGYGLALFLIPGRTAGLVVHRPLGRGARAVVRVLGLREIVQASTCAPRPTRAVSTVGLGVDVLHASTMLILAAASPTWRRSALVSAMVASTFALLGVGERRTLPRSAPGAGVQASRVPQSMMEQFLDLRDVLAARVLRMGRTSGSNRTQRGCAL